MPLDELSIIDRFFRPLAGEGAFGLDDDAGRIAVPAGDELVVTTDMVAANIHFLPGDPPDTVARKALRVNLSDLAAKGATPLTYTLSLGVPDDLDESWLAGFAAGLAEDQKAFGIALLGGDTIDVRDGPVASVTAFGLVPKDRMVHRFNGQPGDVLFVSGIIGAGVAGLAILKGEAGPWDALSAEARAALVGRFRVPEPRVALAQAVREHARAAMDVSDGLVGDLDKMCAVSGCSALLDAGAVPLPAGLEGVDAAVLARLIASGDDYEILVAVPPEKARNYAEMAETEGVPVTRIGTLAAGDALPEVLFNGEPLRLSSRAWIHHRGKETG